VKKTALKKSASKKAHRIVKKPVASKGGNDLFIVGIGASAGGLEALKSFFDNAPLNGLMAFVIVQHLDPTHKSLLSELIAGHTRMKVSEIRDGIKVKPDCVYIIPPNKDLRILNGNLQLIEPNEQRAIRRTIDSFFHSLALDQKGKAIGIILSGTGTEGTLGLKEIKAEGGIAIVQDPETAQFDGMPLSAIAGKTADYILPPDEMPAQLLKYIKKRRRSSGIITPELTVPLVNQLKKIFLIIRNHTGNDFSNYKTNTILRRITKRTALNQIDSIDEYISFLQHNPAEIEKLYKDFLIGVTSFFRDKEVFESIEKKAIPHLMETRLEKQELRIWICGCSTGEEAYSLAILFREALEKNKQFIKVMIFASDIDKESIEFARNGIYSESSLAEVSKERLSHYFLRKENGYQLKKEIREMVVFAHHNVIKDPPFSKMDMISCRNLLIYMNSDLQKRIIPLFHYSLNNDGILLLGTSESIGDYASFFSVFDSKVKIYKKKRENSTRKPNTEYELPYIQHRPSLPASMLSSETRKKINISSLSEKILLGNYAPPSVIIDKNNDALYFSGNTGKYLEPPVGEAVLNILEMAKRGLKPELEKAINKARTSKTEVQTTGVEVKVNEHFQTINLVVKPVLSKDTEIGALMIIFENAEEKKEKTSATKTKETGNRKPKVTELEKELKLTREHLQSAINELETSNEDLQTTNEEYQSSNEELQSTNEELETSREELQSVNEELITVNTELSGKIEQLSQVNDDLNNLLSSIEVATVFLDRNLKIKRFTPTATKIFNLIPSDIDRPVTHLSSNIVYKALVDDVKNALRTLSVKSADVQANDGTWYHMRILPYRTAENIIEGVLVTFVDITDQKKIEEKLKKTNEHLNLIMENLPAVPFTCVAEPEIKISFVGKSCEKVTGFLPEQFINKASFWLNRIHPGDKKKILRAFSIISKKKSFDLPFRWKCADGKYKQFINFIRHAAPEDGRPAYVVGVWQELTEKIKILKVKL
jgi:two-component system CheB/CheR fusion protein